MWDRRVGPARRRGGTAATHLASARVALDAMALHQTPEGPTILLGFTRRVCDVAMVLAEQIFNVRALERGDGTGARLTESTLGVFARRDARKVPRCRRRRIVQERQLVE
jgi:hypothetical protein